LSGGNIREIVVKGENSKKTAKQKQSKAAGDRWGGMNHAVKPKHR